ncbi:hypothetical protein M378DRAFT_751286 [Amanita muscaria Koide BX008]|uniref:Uncharacterized protein n=1 Tax=Amanita muscaria (strain Koide BX008) TaxID=946122 RepID=A0A0C2X0G1_AMAMK|nr:hypothetical protein M378DRAFT_751286 [Amanita muscaria Koide BX008]
MAWNKLPQNWNRVLGRYHCVCHAHSRIFTLDHCDRTRPHMCENPYHTCMWGETMNHLLLDTKGVKRLSTNDY